jgi:16S rRNA (uracil1498-N3)-methyltransferase
MPSVPRIFTDHGLAAGARVTLSAAQAHYLGGVMRRRAGDPVLMFNGRDGEWTGAYQPGKRGEATVTPTTQTRPQTQADGPWLVFTPVKRDATDLIARMATELGAGALLPVLTARSNTHRVNAERLRAIAIEAAEQCERLTLPIIADPVTLDRLLADWPTDRALHAALERTEAPNVIVAGPCALLVGPEGGFTPEEVAAMRRLPFVTPISLGNLILTAETACLAGMVLLRPPGNG